MRKRKHSLRSTAGATLTALLCSLVPPIPSPVAHADEPACPAIEALQAKVPENRVVEECGVGHTQCINMLRGIAQHSRQLVNQVRATCTNMQQLEQRMNNIGAQREAQQEGLNVTRSAQGNIQQLMQSMERSYNALKANAAYVVNAMPETDPRKASARQAATNMENARNAGNLSQITLREADMNIDVLAGVNAGAFLRALAVHHRERAQEVVTLNNQADRLQQNINNGGEMPASRAAQRPRGSGIDPNTLLGLGSALTGLAGMVANRNSSANNGGLSGPNAPGATAPTPTSPNDPGSGGRGLSTSKFGSSDSGAGSKGNGVNFALPGSPKAKETPSGGGAGGGDAGLLSDISSGAASIFTGAGNGSGARSSGSGAAGGGSGAGSAFGGGGDAPGAQASAAGAVPGSPAQDEALHSYPGGGGLTSGGGGGYGSAGASPAPADGMPPPDEGIKDIFNDMRDAAAEGGALGDPAPTLAAEGVRDMDSEDLFPRVRACIVRNLKKGLVLNGLGDRIQP